jgi:hypothetical protein
MKQEAFSIAKHQRLPCQDQFAQLSSDYGPTAWHTLQHDVLCCQDLCCGAQHTSPSCLPAVLHRSSQVPVLAHPLAAPLWSPQPGGMHRSAGRLWN